MRATAFAAALVLLVGTGAATAEPLKLRVGWAQAPSQLTPLVQELMKRHPDRFRHLDKSYVLEPVRFQGSTPQIQGIAAGELEIAALGPSSFAIAVNNAHLEMRIVADLMQDGMSDYFATWWAVRKDGPIRDYADMKNRRAAINALGAMTDMLLHESMRRHGVADNDFTVIEANFANMLAMIENDKVDLVPVMPQFSHDFDATGRYRALFTIADVTGPAQVGMWTVRAEFLAANRAALVDFFEDYIGAQRWFLAAANREEALAIAQAVTKESKESLAYAFTKRDLYRSPDLMPNIKAVQKDIDEAVAMKLLPARIEVMPHYVDLSLVEEAKARIDGK
jgi:sulfonate transport system substrate-binding protein